MKQSFLLFLSLLAVSASVGAETTLQKVPPLTLPNALAYPENVARIQLGARVESAAENAKTPATETSGPAVLLSDDPTSAYSLGAGTTTFLISLARIENVETVNFLNAGTKGEIRVATSSIRLPAESPQWHELDSQTISENATQINIGPGEAKYFRFTFAVTQPGRISGFGIYSAPAASDFTAPRARDFTASEESLGVTPVSYNLADLHVRARVLYVTSGKEIAQANNIIDRKNDTSFAFADSDKEPTAIIDLGCVSTLRRISAIYSSRRGEIRFFVLQSLPGTNTTTVENLPGTLQFPENFLSTVKPVGSVKDDGTQGRASIDFPETAGRYVVIRWNSSSAPEPGFAINEVAAFSGTQPALLAANGSFALMRNSDQKDLGDAKDGDAKDIPAEGPREPNPPSEGPPPTLPQPPPFTFIPQILPVSP